MELQNAGNTGDTGNSQGTTRSQEEEGDEWGRSDSILSPPAVWLGPCFTAGSIRPMRSAECAGRQGDP